jgi:hypothetical protein
MPPHYRSKDDRRAVVLLDDEYTHHGQAPIDLYLREVVEQLEARGLLVYPRTMFGHVGGLIVHHQGAWSSELPAPSAWILDIKLSLGGPMLQTIRDGVALACHLRAKGIQRPNLANEFRPIPIFFLSAFAIHHVLQNEVDATSHLPFIDRIRDGVGGGWRYFRKNGDNPRDRRADEEGPDGLIASYPLADFAEFVHHAAERAVH